MSDNYKQWYDEAMHASNAAGYSGATAAQTISYQATCITELEAQLEVVKKDAERYQWQPIETAPKDGTEIVVGYGLQSGFPKKIVSFNKLHNFWSHYGEANIGLQNNATHCMPLPNPPTMQPKEQA